MLTRRVFLALAGAATALLATAPKVYAQPAAGEMLKLPPPKKTGGMPLYDVLAKRRTVRSFTDKPIPLDTLAAVLWAGCGVNRADSGKRTAPTAHNWQEIDIYVVDDQGASRYDPVQHALVAVAVGDLRAATGTQTTAANCPLNLVFVADESKMGLGPTSDKTFFQATDTGYVSQNVYLACAAEGLGTVVRAGINREALAEKLGLKPGQKITLAQSIGYPKD